MVIVYNRWQESKYKRRAERAFAADHPDVLIDGPAAAATPAAAPAITIRRLTWCCIDPPFNFEGCYKRN